MADTLHLTIVSPAALVFEGQASLVEVPGAEGDMGVLPNHAPVLSMLREGVVTVHTDGKQLRYRVKSGYADISPAGCTILSDAIEAA